MATFFPKRSSWLKQPHYPVGLAPEWDAKIAFASLVGQSWNYDLKTRKSPSVVGTGLSRTVGQQGSAAIASNDTSGLFWSGLTPISTGNNGYAMLFYGAAVSQAESDRAIVLGDEAAANYNQITFIFNSDKDAGVSAGKFALLEYNGGFNSRADSSAGAIDGNYHVFIGNRPAGTSAPSLYKDGLNVTGTSASAVGNSCTAGTSVLCSPGSTTAGFEHPASLAIVFNAPLSSADIALLSANPWVVLERQARHIWVPGSGATTHNGTGALAAGSAIIVGSSAHVAIHPSSGALAAQAAVIAGSAAHVAIHGSSGALVAGAAVVAGSADRQSGAVTHTSTGALVAGNAQVVGSSAHVAVHGSTGALVAGSAGVTGSALNGTAGVVAYSGGYESNFVDFGENARKRRELEELEEPQTQDVEIIKVKPVSQTKPPIKKRQDRLEESTAKLESENAQLKALQIERDTEIKRLILLEQQIRQEDEEILILYAATLRQPMQIAA